jgi:hypothetical protein
LRAVPTKITLDKVTPRRHGGRGMAALARSRPESRFGLTRAEARPIVGHEPALRSRRDLPC